jgi:hypothetical protein
MTTPWRLSVGTNEGHDIALDPSDIYRNYDSAMVGLLYVPRSGIDYHWNRDELDLMSLAELQAVAASRNLGAATDSDNPKIWQKLIINSQRVPVHFSSAAVGWGGQQYATGEGQATTVEEMVGIPDVRFPALAVTRQAANPSVNRDVGGVIRKLGYWQSGEVALQANKPTPVDFTYQIDALALETKHANRMQMWFLREFWDDAGRRRRVRVEIDHGDPWGFIPVYLDLQGVQDTSQLTGQAASAGAEKLLRHTYTVRVEGWLPGRVWGIPTVKETRVIVREGTPEVPGEIVSDYTLGSGDDPANS